MKPRCTISSFQPLYSLGVLFIVDTSWFVLPERTWPFAAITERSTYSVLCTWFPPSPIINVSWRFSPHQHIWLESFISQAVSYHKLSPWSPVVSISHIWIHTLFSARWYLEPVLPQLWPSAMRGSEKPSTELFHSQTQGLAFPNLVFVHHLWWVVP